MRNGAAQSGAALVTAGVASIVGALMERCVILPRSSRRTKHVRLRPRFLVVARPLAQGAVAASVMARQSC